MRRVLAVLAVLWLGLAPALAQEVQLADPKLEQRARDLSREIRCVVCQSQSVADSDADIAKEVRAIIREQIGAGRSDQEIRDYLVARYGDFVLFDPPFKTSTYALWIGPFAILVFAAIGVAIFFRRRAQEPARVRELDPEEQSRVARLLNDREGGA
ncbi:cytochrome c-type biogenesis protein [Dongia deserti]|uniref:cytochrome c-type biogenesis protein n=1 Tax=Dongia deserti TaxID=2268030 RepID=UPI000E655F32|nr:cytochrome c-type biogenesis protein [Dongia deserti]